MRIDRLALALALAAGLVAPAAADWKREYNLGLKAIEAGDWAEAEARFRQALREDGKPAERKQFEGVRFAAYVPHYYAGLAAYRQGACDRALEMWNHAATVQVLQSDKTADLRAQRQKGVGECETRLAQQAKPAVTEPAPAPTVASAPTPTAPTSTPTTTAPSTPAKPVVQTPAKPVATPTVAATPAKPAPAATTPAPAALRSAVEGYLAGRYQDVLKLDPAALGDVRARAHLHLFKAAAAFTLAEQAGAADGLEAAKRDVRAARAALASISPDARLFSPRFRGFWQQTR